MSKKIIRLSEIEMTNLIKRILVEDESDSNKKVEDKFLSRTTNRLEDAYMRRDWIIVREVISDLKHKIRKG